MRRRAVLALSAAAAASHRAWAQPSGSRIYRVGSLTIGRQPPPGSALDRLYPATILRPLGYELGRNLQVESRFAEGGIERLPELADELVRLNLDVIMAGTNLAAFPLKRATRTVPIVVFASHGAAETGLVASYARPGGNITGVESLAPELDVKRLELLRATLPQARTVAVLSNPSDPATALHQKWSQGAAEKLRLQLATVSVSSPADLDSAFAAVIAMRPDAVLVFSDPILVNAGAQIATWALRAGLPLFAEFGLYPRAGGLMSYGASLDDMARRVAVYIDRILKGAKPADLPVERVSTFEMVINMKTAKALGIPLAQSLLLRADEVID